MMRSGTTGEDQGGDSYRDRVTTVDRTPDAGCDARPAALTSHSGPERGPGRAAAVRIIPGTMVSKNSDPSAAAAAQRGYAAVNP
jgi:hypothetical protein